MLHRTRRRSGLLQLLLAAALVVAVAPVASAWSGPVEDYAAYQPQTRCKPAAKPGTRALARWIERQHRPTYASTAGRRCNVGGASEHKEGRAIDWVLDARRAKDRARARTFLDRVFATDRKGNEHALARRMGIMYVIWNDHIYTAYDRFEKRDYLSSACKRKRTCSKTLRHRDHVHISLSRKGGRGVTSWYDGRLS